MFEFSFVPVIIALLSLIALCGCLIVVIKVTRIGEPDFSRLSPVFVPPLREVLAEAEKKKGSPLTQQEVETIAANAVIMPVSHEAAIETMERRGFRDIDADHCSGATGSNTNGSRANPTSLS